MVYELFGSCTIDICEDMEFSRVQKQRGNTPCLPPESVVGRLSIPTLQSTLQ